MNDGPPTPIRRAEAVEVFANRFGRLYDDRVVGPTGVPGRYLRWTWAGRGAVVVPVVGDSVGIWSMYRYPVGAASWEFPRGSIGGGESLEDGALRELTEETGLTGSAARVLGSLFAETGLIGSPVAVVAAVVDDPDAVDPAVETMESVAARPRWLDRAQFTDAMVSGQVTCAITIAAWTMYQAGLRGSP